VTIQDAIIVGGWFNAFSSDAARWKNLIWSPLPDAGGGRLDSVESLFRLSDNTVLIGSSSDAIDVCLHRWDGQSLTDVYAEESSTCSAIAVGPAGKIYIGGSFWSGARVNQYNGTAWSAFPDPAFMEAWSNGYVYSLAVTSNGDLYASGQLPEIVGGLGTGKQARVMRWSGSAWVAVGGLFTEFTYCLGLTALPDDSLVVASTTSPDATILKWNGSAWSSLGTVTGNVRNLHYTPDGTLYAVGDNAGAPTVFRYNGGTSWSAVGDLSSITGGYVTCATTSAGGTLYIGGFFPSTGFSLYRWGGTAWVEAGPVLDDDYVVYALAPRPESGPVARIPARYTIQGVISAEPELLGSVFTYPYTSEDIIRNLSSQVIDLPRMIGPNRVFQLRWKGDYVVVPSPLTAADLPEQVWSLVKMGVVSVQRSRDQTYYDGDGSPVAFNPLRSRPTFRVEIQPTALVVTRIHDDELDQLVSIRSLTPPIAYMTGAAFVCPARGSVAFTPTFVTDGVGQFEVLSSDGTHAAVMLYVLCSGGALYPYP